jgi:hypothetical protein
VIFAITEHKWLYQFDRGVFDVLVSPPPSVRGSLAQTSLAQLLLTSCQEQLTGSIELTSERADSTATIVLMRGRVTKMRTSAGVAYLGSVLYELGYITSEELDASLLQLAKERRPHGRILLERGTIKVDQLSAALREQILRKLAFLFNLSANATFTVHRDADLLPGYGGREMVLVDPLPAIWRGIRETTTPEQIRSVLGRLGSLRCRLVNGAMIERFQFQADEQSLVECLRIKPMSLGEMQALNMLSPGGIGLLVFCLLLAKQIEVLEAPPVRPVSGTRPALEAPRSMPASSMPPPLPGARPTPPPLPGARSTPPPLPSSRPITGTRPVIGTRPAIDFGERARLIVERAKRIVSEDFFRRLDVPRDVSKVQLERTFAALAHQWDPSALPRELLAVRQDCARVLLALGEAYETLSHPIKREAYVRDLVHNRARNELQRDLAASGAKTPFDGAKACLARNDVERAWRLARAACEAEPDNAAALALLAWVEAIDPANQSVEATHARIAVLDHALTIDPISRDALYYRSQLHARLENHRAALRDIRILLEVDPSHVDGQRAFRLYQLRIRRGSIRMRAVDPRLATPPASSSGVVSRVSSAPPGRIRKA